MQVRPYRGADLTEWLRLARSLFPNSTTDELSGDMQRYQSRQDYEIFVVERADGTLAGFVEVGSRPYADGCDTSPVGYVEAWYVDPDVRRSGLGRALLGAAEDWARSRGYKEMASDALLGNDGSLEAHLRAGYQVVDRIVQFRKQLVTRLD
jgi:aminoglycoside 6'-N-acetyltransferase I